MRLLLAFCLVLLPTLLWAADSKTQELVDKIMQAHGGQEKMLKRFRMKEMLNLSSDPDKKGSPRVTVFEAPNHWWLGKTNRNKNNQERATQFVWAWTLGPLLDPKSQLAPLPDSTVDGRVLLGLKLSKSVDRDIEFYFDRETLHLVRLDTGIYQFHFSDMKENDGWKYPAKCECRDKSKKSLYHSTEIVELERLSELPEGLTRE